MKDPSSINASLRIRNATRADLDGLMVVEQTWPADQRATANQLLKRIERFPEGFWVAESEESIAGFTTSCLLHYNPRDLKRFCSWQHATNSGNLFPLHKIAAPNALYVVSTVIARKYRGLGLLEAFFEKHKEMTVTLGLAYSLTGAMLPGYDAYCREHGEVSAYHYALLRREGRLVDPLIRKLTALGYEMPDQRHLLANYFQSRESRDYAALLVYQNKSAKNHEIVRSDKHPPGEPFCPMSRFSGT